MKIIRLIPALVLILSGALFGATAAGATAVTSGSGGGGAYTCTGADGGIIPAGTYSSITVTGVCYAPAGNIDVTGNVTVAPGALLDAMSAGDPVATPLLPADVNIGGNVIVGAGAVLLLGCSPAIVCPSAVTADRVGGSINATEALGVLVHSTAVGGNISIKGGGGGATCGPPPAPWSEDATLVNNFLPVYSDIEDVTIGGNLRVIGLQTCWLGALRDAVGGSATFTGNSMGDPDANEMASDLINGNLVCYGNLPQVQFGDSGAASNIVGGSAMGECGFGVILENGGPSATQNISVPASMLGTAAGTHTTTSSHSTILGTTSSGDTVGETQSDVTLTGALSGTVLEQVLFTSYPDGTSTVLAEDRCACSFQGRSGNVGIVATGTVTAGGVSSGFFQIDKNGLHYGGAALRTLVGWGTYSGSGRTLRLVEHLALG